jgi:hypothetical protein
VRLVPVPYIDSSEREKLRPKAGDVVLYEGTKYIIEQVGMKYVNMHLLENPRVKGMAKMNEVSKYFEPEPEEDDPRQRLNNLPMTGRSDGR